MVGVTGPCDRCGTEDHRYALGTGNLPKVRVRINPGTQKTAPAPNAVNTAQNARRGQVIGIPRKPCRNCWQVFESTSSKTCSVAFIVVICSDFDAPAWQTSHHLFHTRTARALGTQPPRVVGISSSGRAQGVNPDRHGGCRNKAKKPWPKSFPNFAAPDRRPTA